MGALLILLQKARRRVKRQKKGMGRLGFSGAKRKGFAASFLKLQAELGVGRGKS